MLFRWAAQAIKRAWRWLMKRLKWSEMTGEQREEEMRKRHPFAMRYLDPVNMGGRSVVMAPKKNPSFHDAPLARDHDGTDDSGNERPGAPEKEEKDMNTQQQASLQDTVNATILEMCEGLEAFTSLDVSNKVKQDGMTCRHREVARLVRSAFDDGVMTDEGYTRDQIEVTIAGGRKAVAWLYRHRTVPAASYTRRDQVALKPAGTAQSPTSSFQPTTPPPAPATPQPAPVQPRAAAAQAGQRPQGTLRRTQVQTQKGDGRLEVPGGWIAFLDWEEGTEVYVLRRNTGLLLTERLPDNASTTDIVRKFTVDRWGRIRLTTRAMELANINRGTGAQHTLELLDNGILVR